MKILQINKFYYLRGGSEKYLADLSLLLEQKGHTVIPFSMQDGRNWPNRYDKYFVSRVNLDKLNLAGLLKFFYNWQAVSNLKKLIKEEKPEIAHLHNIAHHLTPAIIKVLKKSGIPVVQTLHDYKLICPNYRLFSQNEVCYRCQQGGYYNCLVRKCVKDSRAKSFLAMLEAYWWNRVVKAYDQVDLFIAPSQFMADISIRFGVPKEKIKVLYNFTGQPSVLPKKETEEYLLYFGRLSFEKGITTLLEAAKEVEQYKIKIVGAGPDYQQYEKFINENNLAERVELVGPKYGEELSGLVSNAKAVIFPSVWPENMPISLLETMRAGVVPIAANIGGMPELIKTGENGFLFQPGNVSELVAVIKELPRLDLKSIGLKAQEAVKQYNPENHLREVENTYSSLLSNVNKIN